MTRAMQVLNLRFNHAMPHAPFARTRAPFTHSATDAEALVRFAALAPCDGG